MNKQEYEHWVETRPKNYMDWSMKDMAAADLYIQSEVIKNLKDAMGPSEDLNKLTIYFIKRHWGSIIVDEILKKLGVYPDEMSKL